MVSLVSLWLPIVVSAVLVFVVSSAVHMVLPYHRSDFDKLPEEDSVRQALQSQKLPPGDYIVPHAGSPDEMRSPEHVEKMNQGPVMFMAVFPTGQIAMGPSLLQWFLYLVVVGVFSAYVAGRTLSPGTDYLTVFRLVGTVSFMGYALALWQNSIWYRRKWSTSLKSTVDGLIYALVTAGVFGWRWPG